MTQSLLTCRKRCRSSCDDESSEFTPLSKRINNLHINNPLIPLHKPVEVHSHQEEAEALHLGQHLSIEQQSQWNGGVIGIGGDLNMDRHGVIQRSLHGIQYNNEGYYNPDLSPSENPYYYENNRLLFTLYMERMHRSAVNNQF